MMVVLVLAVAMVVLEAKMLEELEVILKMLVGLRALMLEEEELVEVVVVVVL